MSLVNDIKRIQGFYGLVRDGVVGPMTVGAILKDISARDGTDAGETPALPLDERSREHIASLDAKARERFEQLTLMGKATAATFGCEYVMIEGHRTWAEQDALYAKRPKATNARGGYSNHNFGIAADYGVFRGKSYLDEADPKLAAQIHAAVAVHARRLGFEWGGDWKSLRDYPHYEISTGLTMAEKRKRYAERGSVL
jgi:peptidoglycan L-alanyl-D-glutamate endopeptidase CwlK